uniref:non-specific serine/threonine protein kinase n=1 Tax=Caenorhabditis tropicalis TaxID=1561998 RepID=A0A1I7UPQ0_9PELO
MAVKAFDKNIQEFHSSAELEHHTLGVFNGHQGIVKLLDKVETPSLFCIVLERELIDLRKLAEQTKRNALTNRVILKVGYDVLNSLEYIHSKLYVHRDIKPANIMISSNLTADVQIKTIDLGLMFSLRGITDYDRKDLFFSTCHYSSGRMTSGRAAIPHDKAVMWFYSLLRLSGPMPFDQSSIAFSLRDRLAFETNFNRFKINPCLLPVAEDTTIPDYRASDTKLKVQVSADGSVQVE